jgi:hypothetical protein
MFDHLDRTAGPLIIVETDCARVAGNYHTVDISAASVAECRKLSITQDTLVAVDDCPLSGQFVPGEGNELQFVGSPSVGGKGCLVAEFAAAAGAKLQFAEYQAGWLGF